MQDTQIAGVLLSRTLVSNGLTVQDTCGATSFDSALTSFLGLGYCPALILEAV